MTATAAFDALAADYDAAFTHSTLGGLLRRAVWRRLEAAFAPGDRVLDLGCGTGEDAVHLAGRGVRVLALDAAPGMADVARAKAQAAGAGDRVEVRALPVERLAELSAAGPFDGAYSNFGALNCVADLAPVARDLAACTRSGARVLLCLMGRAAPWEWAWHLARGAPAKAFRRLRPGGTTWRGLSVRYPSLRAVRRAFRPEFRFAGARAVGALLPPSYAEGWARRHPALLRRLDAWERRLEAVPPLPWLADHVLVELVRR